MAARTSPASASVRTGPEPGKDLGEGPIRTCVGCRSRSAATELLRVVVAPSPDATAPAVALEPDPRRRRPGRGAWVHPDPACVELAQRRRAFGRALRVAGPVDPAAVVEYVAERASVVHQRISAGDEEHEQAMKPQP